LPELIRLICKKQPDFFGASKHATYSDKKAKQLFKNKIKKKNTVYYSPFYRPA
jgi:glycine cleavage system aminomethyltransferase T